MDDIYKQAISMHNKFRQYVDQPNHEVALQLKTEMQRLTDEIEVKKNPRTIENTVKNILNDLHHAGAEGVMDHRHVDDLHDICHEMQHELRKLM